MGKECCLIILFIISIITVHLVSWVGSVLHSVPNGGESSYAVFTFREDQNKSMSTNILMNILIPNVSLIFLHLFFYKYLNFEYYDELILYVYFYYVYRLILICVILNRRELFSIKYEVTNFVLGIIVAHFLTKYILINPEQVFIPMTELINEFWLFVILIIYKFVVLILDKTFRQKSVVKEEMLDKYIKNKFDYFYKKYKEVVYIKKEDNTVWILLFAIMIFENYNRGKIIRKLENIKIRLGKSATVGIMQVQSNKILSDEDSIILAYEKLKNEIFQADMDVDDEMQIEYYAKEYNPDEDYSKSVSFIYAHLREYLEKHPRYKNEFFLNVKNDIQEEIVDWKEENEENCGNDGKEQYSTIDDVVQMSGLNKKLLWKIINRKDMIIYLSDDEVQKVLGKYISKKSKKQKKSGRKIQSS